MTNGLLGFLVFFPFPAGLLSYWLGSMKTKKEIHPCGRSVAVVSVALEFAAALYAFAGFLSGSFGGGTLDLLLPEVCGFGLGFTMDGFRAVYALVSAFMWMMTMLLAGEYFRHHARVQRFYLFFLFTLGATMGVFLSADLFTTFLFFETMSFTSYVWVAQEEDEASLRAASTYLAVAVIGGLVMLMGLFLLYGQFSTLVISELRDAVLTEHDKGVTYLAGACMLFGFGAKAGAFPLHIWLPKAHPVAPAPASALLSGVLTKTGIYGILVLSCNLFYQDKLWGAWILAIGVITMFGGALLGVFSVDLKRTLACSSMSQIGFVLVGVGTSGILQEENLLVTNGIFLHMINHSLIKLVLFMAAGVIYQNTHRLDLNSIRGFGRKKPLLKGIFLTGALAIAGIPFFGGYVSKTLLHEAIAECGGGSMMTAAEWLFLCSGGLTVAYMAKLFVAIFIEKNADAARQAEYDTPGPYMNRVSGFALSGSAAVLFLWGLIPKLTMEPVARLGHAFLRFGGPLHEVHYFSIGNLKGAAVSIGIGALVYGLLVRRVLRKKQEGYRNVWPEWLDLENLLYRPLLLKILPTIARILCRVMDSAADTLVVFLRKSVYRDSPLPYEHTEEGNLLTYILGRLMNFFQSIYNVFHTKKHRRDYVAILADRNEEFKETNRIIGRSLSYGLLLFGIGLVLTFVYLIWW